MKYTIIGTLLGIFLILFGFWWDGVNLFCRTKGNFIIMVLCLLVGFMGGLLGNIFDTREEK